MAGAPPVVIVNEMLARRLWPRRSAVGEQLRISGEKEPYTVIAVAPNLKYRALTEATLAYYYLPFAQNYLREMTLQARTTIAPLGLAAPIRQLARELNANAFIREISALDGQIAQALAQPRMTALSAGILGLLLAQMLYGVSATDPATFAGAAMLLVAVALSGSAFPAATAGIRGWMRSVCSPK